MADEFTTALVEGSKSVLEWVKTMLTNPALLSTDARNPFYIPIICSSDTQRGDAQVSDRVIIGQGEITQQKKIIADNVAPGPWSWTFSGYLVGLPELEATNLFTPIVRLQKLLLQDAFKHGLVLTLKDSDCMPYPFVAIQSITFRNEPDCRNYQPIDITLKQLDIMNTAAGTATGVASEASPAAGSADGMAAEAGVTAGGLVDSSLWRAIFGGEGWSAILPFF